MNTEFTEKMKKLCDEFVSNASLVFNNIAVEGHVFGSIAKGTNDALSDVDVWFTFEDDDIDEVIKKRFEYYSKFGEIVLWHEMQNNFPLNGIQTALIYKIEGELIRVDFYLCPFSSSRVIPGSKILFENRKVEVGNIIPETKRTPRELSDRITFFICICFNGIKKIVRGDDKFTDFITSEFQRYQKEIPELSNISKEPTFEMLRQALTILNTVSNNEQRNAIDEIRKFLDKVERIKQHDQSKNIFIRRRGC